MTPHLSPDSAAATSQGHRASFEDDLVARRLAVAVPLPAATAIARFADDLLELLFPQRAQAAAPTHAAVSAHLARVDEQLAGLLVSVVAPEATASTAKALCEQLPNIAATLRADAEAMVAGDPAAEGLDEVVVAYPGFQAVAIHRVAHVLWGLEVPLVPRLLSELAHSRTGIDIHPGAHIGRSFCIDHGTGVVIGETAVIGDDVKVYQGVTLGALSVHKSARGTRRHPTIEDRVVLYAHATVLGGDTVIGHDSVIGGNVWLTTSVPPESFVHQTSEVRVRRVADLLEPTDYSI